ncbi:MAG: GWxTD domain-containing protein [Bacteroidetes bacterium]|nr:GWxTD domain-containing protein [Bacteroidota bacterium]
MKFKIFFLAFLLLSVFSKSYSQNNANLFDFDYAQFSYDSTSNYTEFYYSFNQSALTPKIIDSNKIVEGILKISIIDTTTNQLVVNKQWLMKYPVLDSTQTKDKNLVGMLNFVLPKGVYKCTVSVADQFNEKNKKIISELILVKPFDLDKIAVSDIQLASRILQNSENKNSIFYKNTFEVTPIPTLVFGENIPVVFYYYEVYEHGRESSTPLKVNCIVVNSKGKIFYHNIREISGGIASRVEVGTVPINKYPTDTYSMRIAVLDSINNTGMTSIKRFFVYNPKIKNVDTAGVQQSSVLSSMFGIMSMEECDDLFAKSKYIATSSELSQYSKLDSVQAKREFLFQFWKKRDEIAGTKHNEFFQDYMKRVQESNQKYSSLNRPGWKTDRGRILITYGEPSEIERFPNEIDTKPYEIWHYNDLQGGVIFVFADLTGFSDYQLITSTARGELRDDNWQQRVQAAY